MYPVSSRLISVVFRECFAIVTCILAASDVLCCGFGEDNGPLLPLATRLRLPSPGALSWEGGGHGRELTPESLALLLWACLAKFVYTVKCQIFEYLCSEKRALEAPVCVAELPTCGCGGACLGAEVGFPL